MKDETPECLQRVIEAAKANPYEAFASAAVALAFHNPETCPVCCASQGGADA